jgi:hypothetical protein
LGKFSKLWVLEISKNSQNCHDWLSFKSYRCNSIWPARPLDFQTATVKFSSDQISSRLVYLISI